ncbi:hypothetical protein Tco_1303890 [Tanacetum coccineum]
MQEIPIVAAAGSRQVKIHTTCSYLADILLKLKNFKQDEHVGLKVTSTQEGKISQDDDQRLYSANDLKKLQDHMQDHLDAAERIQHISSLEDRLDYEEQLHDVEVETGLTISLSDEEIALDEAASKARSSEAEEEDLTLEEALN